MNLYTIVAVPSNDPTLPFYAHITIGALRFGLDFFFKYVMLPPSTRSTRRSSGGSFGP